jgi:hypothetical protein
MFKTLRNIYKCYQIFRKHAHLFKVVEDIFRFAQKTHEEQKPMVTKIVLFNMAEGTKMGDFVSLWAGVGNANPIDRASELKAQNTELKRLLKLCLDEPALIADNKEQIKWATSFFE